ncbi:STAS/SEC14 domain-containing protein [Planococcus sp. CAU13]|uniref:STAS/SEC14 domain-containing protein n=1 Tax=Planococcus sp. CAU13 TaxID=1541197 RepID=UPI00052FEEFD|nr:STAS/SEC14 domain-containing protein [Planococcus sp. CAU13]
MLSFVQSKDDNTIAFEFTGKPVKEDADKLENAIKEKFGDDGKFNVLIIAKDVEMPTMTGMWERIKVQTKHMGQIQKAALVSEREWVEIAESMHKLVPGMKTEHFSPNQIDEAWKWIQS